LHGINIFTYLCIVILLVLAYSMNSIVLYRITFAVGLFLIPFGLSAQKPAIDLIPSAHQVLRTEAVADTSFVHDSVTQDNIYDTPSDIQGKSMGRIKANKERRQIGPSMDSLLRKADHKKAEHTKTSGNISLYIIKLNPVKFFIRMIALK